MTTADKVPAKPCHRCGVMKPLSDFYANHRAADGRDYSCKTCKSAARAPRDEYVRRHYAENREREIARAAKWIRDNAARRNARRRARYAEAAEVREKARAAARDRKALVRRRAAGGRVDYARILATFGRVCHLCGAEIGDDLHFDHVDPLALGGLHVEENLRPAHAVCNLRKGARSHSRQEA